MKREEKLLISKIPVLKKLLLKSDKFTKEGIKRNIIPPTFKHLNFIYNLIKKNKRISSLEFGVGWSSLVISKALDENKKKYFYKSLFLKRIFKDNLFMNYVIDAEKKYLKIFKNFSNKIDLKNIRFKKILWQYMLKKNSIVAYGKNLPGIIPDFIYLDGPNPRKIINKSKKFNKTLNFPVIVNDLLFYENFLNNGCILVIEGRAHNASYLLREFKRNWKYQYLKKIDTHIFILNDKSMGILARKLTNFYKK